jgi:hypothetical protein
MGSPPRASSADRDDAGPRAPDVAMPQTSATPQAICAAIESFVAGHPECAVVEDGKVAFDLRTAQCKVTAEHGRCSLHLWSAQRNLVRTVVEATPRGDTLRLATMRFGAKGTKLLELVPSRERRQPTSRETSRTKFLALLERVLAREFPEAKPEGFRVAMDLERSFGPAYARGLLVKGNRAWAVIAVNAGETTATVDGILTLGILWLDHCRGRSDGKRIVEGLRIVLPRGMGLLTASRMAWLNADAAKWQLWELHAESEQLLERDITDTGNVRTRLVHRPDETAARERFAAATDAIRALVPAAGWQRVDLHLRSAAELSFSLHGLEFARAQVTFSPASFHQIVAVTVGVGRDETPLTAASQDLIRERVTDLFARRRASPAGADYRRGGHGVARRIGTTRAAAHTRLENPAALPRTRSAVASTRDPLYRAAPERWLESMLRRDLAPLTRGLAAAHAPPRTTARVADANDDDARGNRLELEAPSHAEPDRGVIPRIIPRLDPRFVYAQVPAIMGASDRGLLDLLGVTADGRLAVIELKADEDLQFALQGLDYWIRIRHHHLVETGSLQRHGYFTGAELAALPPRLYLVAPALRIHPATEIVLRYLSPRVPWQLLALDERWREHVRVLWRKQGGR